MIISGLDIKVIFSMDEKNRSPSEHLDYGDGFALNENPLSVSYDGIAVFTKKPSCNTQEHLKWLEHLHRNIKAGVDAVYVYGNSMDNRESTVALTVRARELGIKVIAETPKAGDDCDISIPFLPTETDKRRLFNFLGAKPIDKSVELMWSGVVDEIKSMPELAAFFSRKTASLYKRLQR